LKTTKWLGKLSVSVRVGPHVPAHSTPHLAAHPGEAFLIALREFAGPVPFALLLPSPFPGFLANPGVLAFSAQLASRPSLPIVAR